MKHILLILICVFSLTSCTYNNYIQLATLKSDNVVYENNRYISSDEHIKIEYAFNNEGGVFFFTITNISNCDLTLVLDKSVFIYNGEVMDYAYRDSAPVIPINALLPINSYRVFLGFDINEVIFRKAFFARNPTADENMVLTFENTDSPTHFSNIIHYTINNKDYILRNDFYIEQLSNKLIDTDFTHYMVNTNCYYIKYNELDLYEISHNGYEVLADDRMGQ